MKLAAARAMVAIAATTAAQAADVRLCQSHGCILISQQQQEITLAEPLLSLTTSHDGSSVAQGGELTISWQASNAPAGSAVALFPQKVPTGHVFDPIAAALPPSGRHVWQIPVFVMQPAPCAPDITGGCIGSMNPTTYRIIARLYTPADASLTEFGPGKVHPTWIAWSESAEFTMLAAEPK